MYIAKRNMIIDGVTLRPNDVLEFDMTDERIRKLLAADMIMESVGEFGKGSLSVEVSLDGMTRTVEDPEEEELSPIEKLDPERKPSRRKG